MKYYEQLADAAANPVIIMATDGMILHKNESARTLLKYLKAELCTDVFELIPNLELGAEGVFSYQNVALRNLRLLVFVYAFVSNDGTSCRALLFEDTPVSSKLIFQIIQATDESITVIDCNGILESANDSALLYIGRDIEERDASIGEDLQQTLIDKGLLYHTLNTAVRKEKKIIRKNISYSNGKVVTYTGTPVFDDEQNLKHVVLTGRDVSRLVELENHLNELEQIKNDYYEQLMMLVKTRGKQDPVCSSKKMEYVLGLASKVAQTDVPIFLTGESGVGKEEVARYIHRNSDRGEKPFIAINCAAIPEQLIESELFGFAGGSFTGANKSGKKGLLEEANGGTFFLDEIGELPFSVQSKLLRVVQEGTMYHIGSTAPINIDVRYISATNLTETELKNSTRFRRDLYYRLCVVPIHIPPLRERKDDIIPLVSQFLESFNTKYNKNIRLSNKVMRKMTRFDWVGNVRELKNVVERLVILSNDGIVDDEQLQLAIDMEGDEHGEKIIIKNLMTIAEAHDLVDKILIEEAYSQYGTIIDAAKALDIFPSTIHRKRNAGKVNLPEKK